MATLAERFPHLAAEWDPSNVVGPTDVAPSSNMKVWWRCAVAHRWQARVGARQRAGCPYCSGRRVNAENSLAALHPAVAGEWDYDKNEKRPEDYRPGAGVRVWWRCVNGHRWDQRICSRISHRLSCPFCVGNRASPERNLALEQPDLVKEWDPGNPMTPEDVLPSSHVKVAWICKHGHRWIVSPNARRRGRGCPYCAGDLATPDDNLATRFPHLVAEWHPANEMPPTTYRHGSGEKAWWMCRKGHEWQARISDRTGKGSGCPRCAPQNTRPQREIGEFVTRLGFQVEMDVVGLLHGRHEVDVWVPSRRLAVEHHGLYYHSAERKARRYHLDKLVAAQAAGIRLIQVFENEWRERPHVVQAYLASILGKPQQKTGARKLVLREDVSWRETDAFLEENHVQGSTVPGHYQAVLEGLTGPVALISCRYARQRDGAGGPPRWELTRYCVKTGHQVIGGFQRLWAAFLRHHSPDRVVSFSDRRWSVGGIYRRAGFVHDGTTTPSYWYFKEGSHGPLFHKSLFQRRCIEERLGPLLPGETESSATRRFGYLRIYDCGLDRWAWSPRPVISP